jgi:uncharacterized delta-60 repeat protein
MPTHKHLVFATTLLLATLNVMAGPGMIDTSYAPGVSGGPVYAEAIQPDGRLVIGGAFYTVGGSSRYHIARLFANGALDTSFQDKMAGASGNVNCLAVQTDGRIVIGGTFTSVNGISRYGVARLNSNGAVDGSFVSTNNYYFNNVNALAVQSDNKVIIGLSYGPSYIYRLNADGSIETAFTNYSSGPSGPIYAVAIQSDGKIIIGGSFTSFNGISRNNIARLNADGSLDMSFLYGLSGAAGTVRCLQVQADGKILIGGDFTTVNGTSRGHSARLTSTGALDTGFNSTPGVNGSVYALALQSDSSVLVAGSFSYYVGSGSYYNNLARFYPDGTADTNFYSNFSSTVYSLAVQSDGGIIAGGSFTVFGQKSQPYLARVYGNLYPPEFITQPTNRVVNVGTNVTFSALVNNPTLTYFQWRKNGSDIPGATGVSYSLYNVQIGDAGTYSVFANNAAGGVTSSNAILQVGIAPAITQQPVSLTVTQGQIATFTVGASGTPLNYFWKKNGTFIPGATNASLTFASVVFTNAATYTCQVSNFLGNVTSAGAVLTVYAPPGILVQPTDKTVGVSSNFTVSVTANGTTPLFYQWLKDGAVLTDFTNASFTITNAQTTDSGGYSVVITNSIGSITSSVATVSVIYYPPTIVSFGVRTNQFGFNINWASGMVVVVEACTNLAHPIWSPVGTNTLISGSSYFSDPAWTNYPGRFYRLRSP